MRDRRRLAYSLAASLALAAGVASAQGFPGLPGLGQIPQVSLPGVPLTLPPLPTFPALPAVPALPTPSLPNATPGSSSARPSEYDDTKAIVSLIDTRLDRLATGRPPFVEVTALEPLETYTRNRDACRADEVAGRTPDASRCPQYEWSVPYSLLSESQEAARGLRRAWQRFEDRYFWRAMVTLNNPSFYFADCWISWGGGVKPDAPAATTHVPRAGVPAALASKLDFPEEDSRLRLDNYFPLPQVPASDYCDDLNPEFLPFMFFPGFCFSVFGVQLFCTDNYPQPIWFNREEAINRVARAVEHAHTRYLLEYQQDALNELLPGKRSLFLPLPWHSNLPGDGAFIAPVMDPASVDPSPFVNTATLARDRLGNANALPYFFQEPLRSPTLDLLLLPGQNQVLYTPPGWWQAEEFKRLLPPSNVAYQERMGYASMFQAWNQVDTLLLPDADLASRALRTLVYWAVGLNINCDLSGCSVTPVPAPVPVEPYQLPFVGPRMHYGWVSVPEGYGIPRVVGTPLYDYRPLLRTDGNARPSGGRP
jgi:hypothetical protein